MLHRPAASLLGRLLLAVATVPLVAVACDEGSGAPSDEAGRAGSGAAAQAPSIHGDAGSSPAGGGGGSAGTGAAIGIAGSAGSSSCCVGKQNPKPEAWASTDRSPQYDCDRGYPTENGCCAKYDQCFTREALTPLLPLPPSGGSGGAAAGTEEEAWRCPFPGEFAHTDGFAICRGDQPLSQLPKRGELCCYTFNPGGCCGRPLLDDGVARVAMLVSKEGSWLTAAPGPAT